MAAGIRTVGQCRRRRPGLQLFCIRKRFIVPLNQPGKAMMIDRYIEWLTKEHAILRDSITMMKRGHEKMWAQRSGMPMEDITDRIIERDERKLAELEALLGGQHGGGFQAQVGEPRRR